MATTRKDNFRIAGLLSLLLGIFLLARTFESWRDDPRNFAYQDGSFPTDQEIRRPLTSFQRHDVMKVTGFTGLVLFAASVVLFARFPAEPDDLMES